MLTKARATIAAVVLAATIATPATAQDDDWSRYAAFMDDLQVMVDRTSGTAPESAWADNIDLMMDNPPAECYVGLWAVLLSGNIAGRSLTAARDALDIEWMVYETERLSEATAAIEAAGALASVECAS